MATPHARDTGLRRIRSITGWIAAAALSGAALISVGVARASADSDASTTSTSTTSTDPGTSRTTSTDPSTPSSGGGIQPPANPPTQGLGGGSAVSGGS